MRSFFAVAKYAVIVVLLLTVARLVMLQNSEQTKILVVHSYNHDLAWVNDIDGGIRRALNDAPMKINARTHYMNLRNHPDCNFYKTAAADVRFTIDDWKPAAVILIDDLAQALVGFNQLDLEGGTDREKLANGLNEWLSGDRCDTPELDFFQLDQPAQGPFPEIVFAGVNGDVDHYGYDDATNVSGIYEHKNYRALIETLTSLEAAYQGPKNGIIMLNDASPTGQTENANYLRHDWSPFRSVPPVSAHSFDDWKAAVIDANARDLMLLIANYQNVVGEDGRPVTPETLVRWTELNAKLPVLGMNTRFVADGGMMTVAIAGSEQGTVAMELAFASLLSDVEHKQVFAKQFLIGMNQSLVRKRDLELPSIYEAFSREIGTFVDVIEQLYVVQNEASQ